jgi:plasmid maintenance system antidote protein VapI
MRVSTAILKANAKLTPREALLARFNKLGWTQTALAVASGVDRAALSLFFAGKKDITTETAHRLAAAMGGWPLVWMSVLKQR